MKKKRSENRQELTRTAYEKLANLLKQKPVCDESFSLEFFDELSIDEIAGKGSSHFTNRQLDMRMLRAGGELLRRAYKGDTDAVSELAVLTRNLATELNLLAKKRPLLIPQIAKSYDEWPVVLSLIDKKKDAESWHGFFKEILKLGEDSFCCTDRLQKIDLTNTWNRYVLFALKAMRLNKIKVPILRAKCSSLRQRPYVLSERIGRTPLQTWFYVLAKGTLRITEWAILCCDLPDRLSNDDAVIKKFMKPLKLAVLEYWLENPSKYENAKSTVKNQVEKATGLEWPTDSIYRSLCFAQMAQSLRTLAGR